MLTLFNFGWPQLSWSLCIAALYILRTCVSSLWPRTTGKAIVTGSGTAQQSAIDPNAWISPVRGLDYLQSDPIPYRPYEFQGHVTMGIQKRKREDWIRLDSGYLNRIAERKELIENKPEYTIGTGTLVNDAIEELYNEIMVDYLPKRFPDMFRVNGKICENMATKGSYPLDPSILTPAEMLRHLGLNVEEDFYIMCPDAEDGQFRLRGYIACFPGGFLSPARVGESVREIHQPVPGYDEKLGRSVDRYFNRMVPGDFIGRMNWSLQTDGVDLFRIDGNNFYPGQEDREDFKAKFQPNLDDCYLRVEHQTLCALPKSRAIIFCVRSYMTSLHDIRRNGEGPKLADAIESMPEKLAEYKMVPYWGNIILPWLRS
ncbi:hypothetical protein CB0940_12232 [Cercospora beticola]|uniref:Uncharacterized protein n=1 Tax=Cercospora beticola TaxID=122368 RepID=A0A2G5GR16_CERBT|nr:hypothetical protein CB0940_12232 [Cercospora beticola]PIA82463.1 hypothetical protein CB0940_12232 [Cercospora beticola]WPB04506.1 hypothetical protein RHO25_009152 [Cercospora beticola]CAK1364249.1 unnamed protein product [Cercospora beticola]